MLGHLCGDYTPKITVQVVNKSVNTVYNNCDEEIIVLSVAQR